MIEQLTHWILDSIRAHGAWSVFVGVLIEQIIVPIPSPLIIMGAGAILVDPGLGAGAALLRILPLVVLPGTVGSTLGGLGMYGLGYWGGKPVIARLSVWLGFGWEDVESMERRLKGGNMAAAIFFLRALPVVPLSLISIAVGVIRWPAGPFTLWTLLGSVPRCLLLGYLGWLLRDAHAALASGLNRLEGLVSVALVGGVGLLVLYLRRRLRSSP